MTRTIHHKPLLQLACVLAAASILGSVPAHAQWDTYWNVGGPRPQSCMFNGNEHFAGDDVCVRPGAKQTCQADGSFSAAEPDPSCSAPETGHRGFSHVKGSTEGLVRCNDDEVYFSVGAEICSAPGAKHICRADGSLSAPQKESACSGRVANN
jgi:hypothetical protein